MSETTCAVDQESVNSSDGTPPRRLDNSMDCTPPRQLEVAGFERGYTPFYFKIMTADLKHHGFQYQLGLNIDNKPFNIVEDTAGLYYADLAHIFEYLLLGTYIAEVEPRGQVHAYPNKYKTDKLYIHSITPFSDWFAQQPESIHLAAIEQNVSAIQYINNSSETVQIAAVRQFGYAIRGIKNPSYAVQLAAVQKDGTVIRYIPNPSEEIQIAAVQTNSFYLESMVTNYYERTTIISGKYPIDYIPNPSEAVKLAAARYRSSNININSIE